MRLDIIKFTRQGAAREFAATQAWMSFPKKDELAAF